MEPERFEDLLGEVPDTPRRGDLIVGNVITKTNDGIFLNINYKSEGIIPLSELSEEELAKIKEGKELKAVVMGFDSSSGLVRLSKVEAEKAEVRDMIKRAFRNRKPVKGKVIEKVRGGFIVELLFEGYSYKPRAFMPFSHSFDRGMNEEIVNSVQELLIVDDGRPNKNPIVSRKEYLSLKKDATKSALIEKIKEGEGIIKAKVISVKEFGVFLEHKGAEIYVKKSDVSRRRIKDVKDAIKEGENVELRLIEFNEKKDRFIGSIKDALPDPWENIDKIIKEGDVLRGKVTGVTKFGGFVEIKEGVEGLIHISELSWSKKIRNASEILKEGDVVDVMVLKVNKKNRRISLSLRKTIPNPYRKFLEENPPGTRVKGVVNGVSFSRVFLKLNDDVEGFVKKEDVSWGKNPADLRDLFKRKEEVEAVVLGGNPENFEIILGIKQLTSDPWLKVKEKYHSGDVVKGKISNIISKGIFVKLDDKVEGFLPLSETLLKGSEKIEEKYKEGMELEALIINISNEKRNITLSIKQLEKKREKEALDKIMGASKGLPSIGDIMGDILKGNERA